MCRLDAVGVLAAVLVPLDVELGAQDAGLDERTDVETDTVVEVRVPAEGLLGERLPAHEDVVGRLALEDQRETALEIARGKQARLCPGETLPVGRLLPLDPVAEVGVGESSQRAADRVGGS